MSNNDLFNTCTDDCPDNNLNLTRMVISSLEELRLALRLLVEPYHNRSAESCLVHLNQAWLYLYQLTTKLDNHCVMEYDHNNNRKNSYKDMKHNLILREQNEHKRFSKEYTLSPSVTSRMPLKRNRNQEGVSETTNQEFSAFRKVFNQFRLEETSPNGALIATPAYLNLVLMATIRNHIEHRAVMHFYAFTLLMLPYIIANVNNYFSSLEAAVNLLPKSEKDYLNRFYPEATGTNFVETARAETKLPLMFSLLDDYYTLEKYSIEEGKAMSALKKHGENEIAKCIEQYDSEIAVWSASQDEHTRKEGQKYTHYKSIAHVKILESDIKQLNKAEIVEIENPIGMTNDQALTWLKEFSYSAKDVATEINKRFQNSKFKVGQGDVKSIAQHLKVRLDRPNRKYNSVDGESCIYIPTTDSHLYSIKFIEKTLEITTDEIKRVVDSHRSKRTATPIK